MTHDDDDDENDDDDDKMSMFSTDKRSRTEIASRSTKKTCLLHTACVVTKRKSRSNSSQESDSRNTTRGYLRPN